MSDAGLNLKKGCLLREAVYNRRSVRSYALSQVKSEDIQIVLDAAVWAPSGLNNQPWKFKVIIDKDVKMSLSRFTKYGRIIINAPVVICVFLDKAVMYDREKDIMAVGACIQNMLLSAYGLGLGTCWLGEVLNAKEDVAVFLNVPAECELMAVVTLGYPRRVSGKGARKELNSFLL